jgi:hypothetical protein
LVDRSLEVSVPHYVARHTYCPSSFSSDRCSHILSRRSVHVGHGDSRTRPGESFCNGPPDTSARACDQSHCAVQSELILVKHGPLLLSMAAAGDYGEYSGVLK